MARLPRFVRAHLAVHATARGVNGCRLFRSGFDKRKYLKRFALVAEQEGVEIHGYCLLGNHVHFLLVPQSDKALARLFLRVHTWWAMYYNAKYDRTGHLFQGRFHSSVLSKSHYWAALRYIETNPRKHNLSNDLAAWEYSSAAQHLTGRPDEFIKLMMGAWHRRFTTQTYRGFLEESAYELAARLEKSLTNGLPCGPDRWVRVLAKKAKRRLHPLPPGRPPRPIGQPKVFAA
jgi:putative transposase